MDKNQEILNAYISIEIDDSGIEKVFGEISNLLSTLEIPHERCQRPHVSIAYTIGKTSINQLEQIVSEISEAPFIIEGQGISVIPGKVVNKDFVSLKIKDNDDFLYAQEFIAENCDVQESFDGVKFIGHISLFMIDKGLESVHEDLARVLELNLNINSFNIKLKGLNISVFNKERELIISKKI